MANDQHIKWLLEGVEAWNRRREREDFQPDFEEADIASEKAFSEAGFPNASYPGPAFFGANFRNAIFKRANLTNAIFNDADLTGANFYAANLQEANLFQANLYKAELREVNLTKAKLITAKLIEANLFNADLSQAELIGADLTDADLFQANLTEADLTNANLTGTDLSYSEPWKACLYPTSDVGACREAVSYTSGAFALSIFHRVRRFFCTQRTESRVLGPLRDTTKEIKSIECLLKECRRLRDKCNSDNVQLYFRGEKSSSWELRPSIMRSTAREWEAEMLADLMLRQPDPFSGLNSAIEQWALAQHHRLETRLLDITRNPLVALFYACEEGSEENGRLHIFAVPKNLIKPFNSDTISIIANFSKLRRNEQDLLLGKNAAIEPTKIKNAYARVMDRLYHFIRHEKSYFLKKIEPRNLFQVFVVEPKQSFERIRAQSGAFLISAFHERFECDKILEWNSGIPVYDHYMLKVAGKCKEDLMDELSLLDITSESLFPGLDEAAKAVTQRYS